MAFDWTRSFDVSADGFSIDQLIAVAGGTESPIGNNAPIGSIYLRTNGERWKKHGANDTDWRIEPNALEVPFFGENNSTRNNGLFSETTQEAIEEVKDLIPGQARLERNFYVAKNGNDTTGDGSISAPFLTIGAAITYINANYTLSATQNAVIIVAAGEYIEDTLILPSFCSLWGHHYRTRISSSSGSINLIESAGSHTIRGVLLTGVTAVDKYLVKIDTPTGKRVTLQDISFSDYESIGTISNAIYINSATGLTTVRIKQCDFEDIQSKIITLDENSRVVIRGAQVFDCSNAIFLEANNNTSYSIYNVDIDSVYVGVAHYNTEDSDISTVNLLGATIPYIKTTNGTVFVTNVLTSTPKAQFSSFENIIGYFSDVIEGDTAFKVVNELSVGTPNKGKESVFGEGDSYFQGMHVYTSDGTDTATSEGILTNVTTLAQEQDLNYFGFQGNTANYCIYVCTDVENDAFGTLDNARIMGLKVSQITACVEPIEKSIVFESWDGIQWVQGKVFCSESNRFYRYGNDIFIRENSSEHIRFGRDLILDSNQKKTIESKERYWIRIRIKNDVTIAPTFNQFKISNNRTEINADGTITFHGLARHLVSLSFQSNTFGETGGVTNASFQIGSGIDYPHDNWIHTMKNNQLNGSNDAIYANAIIPEGCCTSCPLALKIKYLVINDGVSPDGELKISAFFSKTEGIPVADRNGGKEPINRPVAEATSLDIGPAQTVTTNINLTDSNKILTAPVAYFNTEDNYEGDVFIIRVGLNDNGNNKKIAIIGIDVEYLKWTLGTRL